MDLNQIIKESHNQASAEKEKGADYRRCFLNFLLPAVQDLYKVNLSQREMGRFEKQLWSTVDLYKQYQGLKKTGPFLQLVSNFTDKFMREKKQNSGIKPH